LTFEFLLAKAAFSQSLTILIANIFSRGDSLENSQNEKLILMKAVRNYLFALLTVFSVTVNAQDLRIPQPSTLQKIEQDFGLGQIIVT
jgi:hypothetical protein